MDLIRDYKHINNEYTKKIKITKYTEGESITIEKEGVKDICEVIISQNDQEYNTMQKQQRENYIVNKKLEIADNVTKNEKYNKNFSPKLIQTGLQNKNYLSSILYMNELYKVNTTVFNSITNKFYKTSYMEYPMLFCEYKNNTWHYLEDVDINQDTKFHQISELSDIITQDTSMMIFKSTMLPISKYKVKDLEDMCVKLNLETSTNGKKKLKKELYDQLSLHCFQS
jgi:hypothetical protein